MRKGGGERKIRCAYVLRDKVGMPKRLRLLAIREKQKSSLRQGYVDPRVFRFLKSNYLAPFGAELMPISTFVRRTRDIFVSVPRPPPPPPRVIRANDTVEKKNARFWLVSKESPIYADSMTSPCAVS